MERKTAATMIAERYGCNCHEIYTSRRMADPECTLHSEGEEIEELMTQFADQEKEAEAAKYADFLANNCEPIHVNTIYSGKWHYLPDQSIKTTSELYQIFKQQTGGK